MGHPTSATNASAYEARMLSSEKSLHHQSDIVARQKMPRYVDRGKEEGLRFDSAHPANHLVQKRKRHT